MNYKLQLLKVKLLVRHFFRSIFVAVFPNNMVLRKFSFYPIEKEVDLKQSKFCKNRFELYDHVNRTVLNNEAIDYLEFGVYQGESLKYWTRLNTHAQSRFWGFDTFTGLPENWESQGMPKGHFDTHGVTPVIDDSRVAFVKGLFQQTLLPFLSSYQPENRLLIHNDSDLYSSTLYVLVNMHPFIKDGTVIIFDEFSVVLDELRALKDYSSAFYVQFDIIAHTPHYSQAAIILKRNPVIYG
jgi:Macrocin-O-methyltransferase (TylF)